MSRAALNRTTLFLLLATLLLSGCDRLSSRGKQQEIVAAYVAFRTALSSGDLAKATGLMASNRAREIKSDPAAGDKLRLAAFMLPGTMTVMGVKVEGDGATLSLREGAMVTLAGGSSAPALAIPGFSVQAATGTVTFLREEGEWKLDKESWNHDLTGSTPPPATPRPFLREGGAAPRLLRTMGGQNGTPMRGGEGVATGPDGTTVIAIGDQGIVMLASGDGREIARGAMEHHPTAVGVTPDGGIAITLDTYGGVTFWPLTPAGFGPPQRSGNVGQSSGLSISRNGRYLATASFEKLITIWDIPARREITRLTTPEPMRSIAFSPSGQLLAAGSVTNSFTLWDLESRTGRTYTIPKVDAKSDVSGIAFSPDGKRLATSHMDSSITLWDVTSQSEVKNFFVSQSSSWTVRFSPDGRLFATATQGGSINLWSSSDGAKLGELKGQPSQPMGLEFSPDGSMLYSLGEKGEVAIWGSE
jgi:6-phosphogluconolactonase (cycloisomerase 2 family)